MQRDLADRLMALLEREHRLLLSGDLQGISALIEDKEEIAQSLAAQDDMPAARSQELRKSALRNQSLLEASVQGVSAARERLAEIGRAKLRLDTYTGRGDVRSLVQETGTLERRA